jgi:hypothetical protein
MATRIEDPLAAFKTWAVNRDASALSRSAATALSKAAASQMLGMPTYVRILPDGRCRFIPSLPEGSETRFIKVKMKRVEVGRCPDGSLVVGFVRFKPGRKAISRDWDAIDSVERMATALSWYLQTTDKETNQ